MNVDKMMCKKIFSEPAIKVEAIAISLLLVSPFVFADQSWNSRDKDEAVIMAKASTVIQAHYTLASWTDDKMIARLKAIPFNDASMKNLYSSFTETLVSPPNPDKYQTYSINDAENALVNTELLGRRIHNLLFALPEEDVDRYGTLLHIMRDTLYLDSQHIPMAIKNDNARDAYWYELHNKWVDKAADLYKKLNI